MVPEASKPVMMGEAGKGALADFLVSIGGLWRSHGCGRGGGGYLGIVVRERIVGGLGEGKWIALMDMVGREGFFFFLLLRSSCFVFCNWFGDVEFRMVQ